MSSSRLQLDAWLDDELGRVPLPDGLMDRLRQIPRMARQLDLALVDVPLPGGLVTRLQTSGSRRRRAHRRDCVERSALAAVLLLAVGGSYAASLAAFLWTSCPAARVAAAADQPRFLCGAFASVDDVRFDTWVQTEPADSDSADSPATARVFNEAVAAAHLAEGGAWHASGDSEPFLLASADVSVAIEEHIDRLWRQGRGADGRQALLSPLGPGATDDGLDALKEWLDRSLAGRWADWPGLWGPSCLSPSWQWPGLRKLVAFFERLAEPSARRNGPEGGGLEGTGSEE